MIHILREIKLSKLTDTAMSNEASRLDEFWNELWTDMKMVIDIDKGEIKCWKDGYDYYYFLQDGIDEYLWCDYDDVWKFFRHELGMNHKDVQELIQQMVAETLNCGVNTPTGGIPKTKFLLD